MAEPFKDLFAAEKNHRLEDAERNAHSLRLWRIAAATGAACTVLLGAAFIIRQRPAPTKPQIKGE